MSDNLLYHTNTFLHMECLNETYDNHKLNKFYISQLRRIVKHYLYKDGEDIINNVFKILVTLFEKYKEENINEDYVKDCVDFLISNNYEIEVFKFYLDFLINPNNMYYFKLYTYLRIIKDIKLSNSELKDKGYVSPSINMIIIAKDYIDEYEKKCSIEDNAGFYMFILSDIIGYVCLNNIEVDLSTIFKYVMDNFKNYNSYWYLNKTIEEVQTTQLRISLVEKILEEYKKDKKEIIR